MTVNAASIAESPPFAADSALDLRGKTPGEAKAAVQQELAPMTGMLLRLLAEMPEDARAKLTHALRNDDWMNAPAVLPLNGNEESILQNEENQWLVSEEVEDP